MSTRIVIGLLGIPLVFIPTWFGGIWVASLILVVGFIGANEFYQLLEIGGYRPVRWIGLPWLVLLILHHAQLVLPLPANFSPHLLSLSFLLTFGMIATVIYCLFQAEKPLHTWMSTSLVAIYIGILCGEIIALRLLENGFWWLVLGVFVTWGNDTFAYFTGVAIGKHKLWPRLSPKKSWEGTIAGWSVAALFGGLLTWLTPLDQGFLFGAVLGAIGGVLALFGDLSISMLKRQIGVKDTSNILLEHGGMLDRLDSILFVFPFFYHAVMLWQ